MSEPEVFWCLECSANVWREPGDSVFCSTVCERRGLAKCDGPTRLQLTRTTSRALAARSEIGETP